MGRNVQKTAGAELLKPMQKYSNMGEEM